MLYYSMSGWHFEKEIATLRDEEVVAQLGINNIKIYEILIIVFILTILILN